MRKLLEKKSFWFIALLVVIASPTIAYFTMELLTPSGETIRLHSKGLLSDTGYLIKAYLLFAGLFTINLSLLFVFSMFSYFTIINMIGIVKKNVNIAGIYGSLIAAAFTGAVLIKSAVNLPDLMSQILQADNHYHAIRFTPSGDVLFLHDFKGIQFSRPSASLTTMRGTCQRRDKILEEKIILRYTFTLSFIFSDTSIHGTFSEFTRAQNSEYITYIRLSEINKHISRPLSLVLNQCPTIEMYPPGFASTAEITGAEPYKF
ncbi:MAG: hypothetical protein ABUK01_00180 [Leptospirales bacterium]